MIAFIEKASVVKAILEHLKLPSMPLPIGKPRGPPELLLDNWTAALRFGGHGVVRRLPVQENARARAAFRADHRYPGTSTQLPALPGRSLEKAAYSDYPPIAPSKVCQMN